MRLARIVEVSLEVAATRARSRKITLLADAIRALSGDEFDPGIAFLAGEPRQARLHLGPAAVYGTEVDAADRPSLTILAVDGALQAIAEVASGSGSRTRRIERFRDLLARATPDEQTWLRALVLRELRQGALEGLLVQAIARAADVEESTVRRAAMLSGDLRATASAALEGGQEALDAFRLQVGAPLLPMLAASATDVDGALVGLGEVAVDAKLDGARIQVHRDGRDVAVFTRNLLEVTGRVPEVVELALALPVTSVVLDGEVLTLDPDGRPRAFQDTMQRFGSQEPAAIARDVALHPRFFDILHLDGQDVIDDPLRTRLDALRRAVPDRWRIDQLVTDDPERVREFLRTTLAAGHEGVMVKDLDTPYAAGRRGAGWRKLKPVHSLDLVVLAAEWGSGRRRGWLSNLHLGCRADATDARNDTDGFVMLGKTFKGLTDEVLAWQTEALLARETHREGHVLEVRPELVVEVALDGVVRSSRYPGGLSLRFARVRRYRPDKSPDEADTLATVRAIHRGELPAP